MKLNELNESVTFSIGAENENESFKDVLSMAQFLSYRFYEAAKKRHFFAKYLGKIAQDYKGTIRFDSDGDDAFKKTGIINVYPANLNEHFKEDFRQSLMEAVRELAKYVKVGKISVEGHFDNNEGGSKRKPHKAGEPIENVGVIRVPVLENEIEVSDSPEMNLSNDNARAFLNTIGINDSGDLSGTIPHKDMPKMLMRLRNLSKDRIDNNTRTATDDRRAYVDNSSTIPAIKQGARMIDQGLNSDRILQYIDSFIELLTIAHKNKKDVIYG